MALFRNKSLFLFIFVVAIIGTLVALFLSSLVEYLSRYEPKYYEPKDLERTEYLHKRKKTSGAKEKRYLGSRRSKNLDICLKNG